MGKCLCLHFGWLREVCVCVCVCVCINSTMIMYDNCMFAYKVKVQQVKNESPKEQSTIKLPQQKLCLCLMCFSGCLVGPKYRMKNWKLSHDWIH